MFAKKGWQYTLPLICFPLIRIPWYAWIVSIQTELMLEYFHIYFRNKNEWQTTSYLGRVLALKIIWDFHLANDRMKLPGKLSYQNDPPLQSQKTKYSHSVCEVHWLDNVASIVRIKAAGGKGNYQGEERRRGKRAMSLCCQRLPYSFQGIHFLFVIFHFSI